MIFCSKIYVKKERTAEMFPCETVISKSDKKEIHTYNSLYQIFIINGSCLQEHNNVLKQPFLLVFFPFRQLLKGKRLFMDFFFLNDSFAIEIKYTSGKHSQVSENWIMRAFNHDVPGPFFVAKNFCLQS